MRTINDHSWIRHTLYLCSSLKLVSQAVNLNVTTAHDEAAYYAGQFVRKLVYDFAKTAVRLPNAVWDVSHDPVNDVVAFDVVRDVYYAAVNVIPPDGTLLRQIANDVAYRIIIAKHFLIQEKIDKILSLEYILPMEDATIRDFMIKLVDADISKLVKQGQAHYLILLEQILNAIPGKVGIENVKREWENKVKLYELRQVFESGLTVQSLVAMAEIGITLIKPIWAIIIHYTSPYSTEEKLERISCVI